MFLSETMLLQSLVSVHIPSVCAGGNSSVAGSFGWARPAPRDSPWEARLLPWGFPQRPQCLVPDCGPSPSPLSISGGLALRCHRHTSTCSSAEGEHCSETVPHPRNCGGVSPELQGLVSHSPRWPPLGIVPRLHFLT